MEEELKTYRIQVIIDLFDIPWWIEVKATSKAKAVAQAYVENPQYFILDAEINFN